MGRPSRPGALRLAIPWRAVKHSATVRCPSQRAAMAGDKEEDTLLSSEARITGSVGLAENKDV